MHERMDHFRGLYSRGSSISSEIQQRGNLLSELWQRPYHTPLESPPWHPHQDLQIPRPWSPQRPHHPVLSCLSKPIVNSIPNYYFFTLIFFLGIIRSCVHVVEIDKSFTGMYQQVVLFVNFVAMMARFVFFFFNFNCFSSLSDNFLLNFIFIKFGNFYQQ